MSESTLDPQQFDLLLEVLWSINNNLVSLMHDIGVIKESVQPKGGRKDVAQNDRG